MTTIVPIFEIKISDERQRQEFDQQKILQLRDSISKPAGLLNPVMLRQEQDGLWLVAGEHRIRAIAGLTEPYTFGNDLVPVGHVPAVIKNFSEELEWVEAELHENIIRQDLTWQERVRAIAKLHALYEDRRVRNPKYEVAKKIANKNFEHGGQVGMLYGTIQDALLIKDFLQNDEVSKCKTQNDALRAATRLAEEEYTKRVAELRAKEAQAKNAAAASNEAGEGLSKDLETSSGQSGQGQSQSQAHQEHNLSFIFKPKENFTLINGDCIDVMGGLRVQSYDLILTDPPYMIGADEFGMKPHRYDDSKDQLDTVLMALQIASHLAKPSCHMYVFCDEDYFVDFKDHLSSLGWRVRRKALIWDKGVYGTLPEGTPHGYRSSHELILLAQRGTRPFKAVSNDTFYFSPVVADRQHQAQKPVPLLRHLLTMSAVPGDQVLDPFCGSGSIFDAARGLNLQVTGIEKDERFARIAHEKTE